MNTEAVAQLVQVLEKTISPDQAELKAAQHFLESAAQTNLPELIKTLSDVLYQGGNSAVVRQQAGVQLKNFLYTNDESLRAHYEERWLAMPEDIRNYTKANVVNTLGTESFRPSAAAQCIQLIAMVELPRGLWPGLISILVHNVTDPESTSVLKECTLQAIGYICQDVDSRCLEEGSNEILTAIVHGMRRDEPSNQVKLASTNALLNSLEFTRGNFEKETERHFIMQVVCEATQNLDVQVKVSALQCLVKIMSLYYQYMEAYMGQALFAITLDAMRAEQDEVALQGIEFWSNVCDEEVDLQIEASEATEAGRPPEHVSRFYAKGALQFLVPALMQSLCKQEEFDDEDDWNPYKAAGVCMMLLATCCEDDIVPHVLPFVKDNIKDADWRHRDAALMAFGCILEGPDPVQLKPLVEQAMPMLIETMKDSSVVVKDTAAWTIGRVCELIPEAAINPTTLQPLLEALVTGLSAEPRVASNVCWAFSSLAEAAYDSADRMEDEETPRTYCLSPFFSPIVEKLLWVTDREDAGSSNLRAAAYEALMETVKNSPKDCYDTVQKTTVIILQRLQQVLQMETHIQNQTDRAQFNDLQSLLCATLQSVLRKVEPAHAPAISDTIMTALLQMFQSSTQTRAGGVQEDALMAVATLVEVLGESFIKYMEAFKPFLLIGLKNIAEYQVCHASVGLVGDICRALGNKITLFSDEIMEVLMSNLSDNSVHRTVKPQILSVFGDMALAVGPEYVKYLDVVMTTLMQASQCQVDRSDFDMIDYLNELREGCLEAYTGIIQGLKGDENTPTDALVRVQPHVAYIVQFITVVAQDSEHSDASVAASAGLIGDLCAAFGKDIVSMLDVEPISELLTQGRRSKMTKTKTLSTWATKEIRKLKNASSTGP
ncbi:importin subunit beta-1 [Eurytemora carolleeae]|uniref:importin subunit beta-1 n=1 Tax=Eurytemora carolleeae TaxID=1294199 RepID=UPI000C78F951|nr:importin subunit beta-1 [Eurytemora carolleeae]XP_023325400.1 importin subunit beta-1 [Eurytemora carolleeae]XP_023325401.1 importin subunit beta-1 [Eurytemora carolleeae]|eukprot:XP_023325397.1 importin subunit beta-1-like [Eurytemora affinis]